MKTKAKLVTAAPVNNRRAIAAAFVLEMLLIATGRASLLNVVKYQC